MPVSAQNVMQKGKVEDMVSLIKLSERLAEAKVKKALKSDKNNTDMIANIGQAYLQAGKVEEAEKYFWIISVPCISIVTILTAIITTPC